MVKLAPLYFVLPQFQDPNDDVQGGLTVYTKNLEQDLACSKLYVSVK